VGSPADEPGRAAIEGPPHEVKIGRRFAVASDEAVFSEWDLCVKYGDCPPISDGGWGRGNGPVINITWFDAKRYVAWLSRMTGRDYRLLAEAEYEYATRAHTTTAYYWGPNLGKGNASCNGCGTRYDGVQPAPAGSFPANGFGLHDMVGNVWEWVDDCYNASYEGAPTDGSAWIFTNCPYRVARGGTWTGLTKSVLPRSAIRDWRPPDYPCCGFRVARTLVP
jgi:formylglycine-generating enzyme required for sulfatase activity